MNRKRVNTNKHSTSTALLSRDQCWSCTERSSEESQMEDFSLSILFYSLCQSAVGFSLASCVWIPFVIFTTVNDWRTSRLTDRLLSPSPRVFEETIPVEHLELFDEYVLQSIFHLITQQPGFESASDALLHVILSLLPAFPLSALSTVTVKLCENAQIFWSHLDYHLSFTTSSKVLQQADAPEKSRWEFERSKNTDGLWKMARADKYSMTGWKTDVIVTWNT